METAGAVAGDAAGRLVAKGPELRARHPQDPLGGGAVRPVVRLIYIIPRKRLSFTISIVLEAL